jgi:hypothetical protein
MGRRKGCRCTGDPQHDPCGWCRRDIWVVEDRGLWGMPEDSWPDERSYERWLGKLFGGSE